MTPNRLDGFIVRHMRVLNWLVGLLAIVAIVGFIMAVLR